MKPDSDPTKKSMAESEVNSPSDTKAKLAGGANEGTSPPAFLTYHRAHDPNISLCHLDTDKKKHKLRVKWQDHFGGVLTLKRVIDSDGEETKGDDLPADGDVSWSDRKKRDRLREKELLSTVKYVFTSP